MPNKPDGPQSPWMRVPGYAEGLLIIYDVDFNSDDYSAIRLWDSSEHRGFDVQGLANLSPQADDLIRVYAFTLLDSYSQGRVLMDPVNNHLSQIIPGFTFPHLHGLQEREPPPEATVFDSDYGAPWSSIDTFQLGNSKKSFGVFPEVEMIPNNFMLRANLTRVTVTSNVFDSRTSQVIGIVFYEAFDHFEVHAPDFRRARPQNPYTLKRRQHSGPIRKIFYADFCISPLPSLMPSFKRSADIDHLKKKLDNMIFQSSPCRRPYRTLARTGSHHSVDRSTLKLLFLLRTHHIVMNQLYSELCQMIEGYFHPRERFRDVFLPDHREITCVELKIDILFLRTFKDAACLLTEQMTSLLPRLQDCIQTNAGNRAQRVDETLAAGLIKLHSATEEMVSKCMERVETQLRFLEGSHNIHELQFVKRISALATIFLPLSLAATLLSMQAGVNSLGVLWKDYVTLNIGLFLAITVFFQFSSVITNLPTHMYPTGLLYFSFYPVGSSRLLDYPFFIKVIIRLLAFVTLAMLLSLILHEFATHEHPRTGPFIALSVIFLLLVIGNAFRVIRSAIRGLTRAFRDDRTTS